MSVPADARPAACSVITKILGVVPYICLLPSMILRDDVILNERRDFTKSAALITIFNFLTHCGLLMSQYSIALDVFAIIASGNGLVPI